MRVALVIGDVLPRDGGGYTFVEDVVNTLAEFIVEESELKFTFFCEQKNIELFKSIFPPNLDVIGIKSENFFFKLISHGRSWIPLIGHLWWKQSELERELTRNQMSFVWFLGAYGEVLDLPYMATVWDLQHRTHPWFPEVSRLGTWDTREVGFATYLRRASFVITGTEIGASQLSRYYQIAEDRICILPHPTPSFVLQSHQPNLDRLSNRLDITSKFFFYPAQFWPHKNHATLIKSFSKFNIGDEQNVKLVLTGADKGNLKYLEALVSELGLCDRVLFLGFVDRGELVWLYKNAIALVYPSFSGPENLPPLEAFALGCPVLYSKFPGAYEQLGDAALYFDPTSEQCMLNALRSIRDDHNLRNLLVVKGLIRAGKWQPRDYALGAIKKIKDFSSIRRSWGL